MKSWPDTGVPLTVDLVEQALRHQGRVVAYAKGRQLDEIAKRCNTWPDLLEACVAVRDMAAAFFPEFKAYDLLIDKLNAAIAKATE